MIEPDQYTRNSILSLRDGIMLLHRLREQFLPEELDLTWIFPRGFMPSTVGLYGIQVIHADVYGPYLAHRVPPAAPEFELNQTDKTAGRYIERETIEPGSQTPTP